MIGCGDLCFSASVLCNASCNVEISRRSRCLIKSAFLSILLAYSQLEMVVFRQVLTSSVQVSRI
jgi:hypothetical protein